MTVTIGIDPHKSSHTAVAIDANENVIDEIKIRSCSTQADRLRNWADQFEQRDWAVESARGLGYLLAQQLVAAGEHVVDVPPTMASRVRVLGTGRSQKSDPNDARSIAIAALRSDQLAAVCPDDHAQVLRLLAKRHRDLGRLKNKACCRLHALLIELVPGGVSKRMHTMTRTNAVLDAIDPGTQIDIQRIEIARELVADIDRYDQLLASSKRRIETAIAASGTTLQDLRGCGPICAAMIIGYTGDIDRFATKGHFASFNATAPIEASSGNRVRHRLNPRGNRQMNWAIHVIAISQLRYPGEGRAYYDRKVAEGKTSKEAIRSLKRRISDRVYRHLVDDARLISN
jgi:transposase